MSRNTVRKILRTGETDVSYERERQPMPRIGPWQGQLERFLSSNAGKPSRERLTLIRIFEELRGLGYEGGYDAVRRFAKGWSQNRGAMTAEADVPLYHAPGEAYQFDWSHEVVVISGVTVTVRPRPSVRTCCSCSQSRARSIRRVMSRTSPHRATRDAEQAGASNRCFAHPRSCQRCA